MDGSNLNCSQFTVSQSKVDDRARYLHSTMEEKYPSTSFVNDCVTYTNLQLDSEMIHSDNVSSRVDTSNDFLHCVTSGTSEISSEKQYTSSSYYTSEPKEYNSNLLCSAYSTCHNQLSSEQSAVALTLASLTEYSKVDQSLQTYCESEPLPSVSLSVSSLNSPPTATVEPVSKQITTDNTYTKAKNKPKAKFIDSFLNSATTISTHELDFSAKKDSSKFTTPTGYRLIDLECLASTLFPLLICDCGMGNLNLKEDVNESSGYYAALKLVCNSCERNIPLPTCNFVSGSYDVNVKAELLLQMQEITQDILKTIFKVFDISCRDTAAGGNDISKEDVIDSVPYMPSSPKSPDVTVEDTEVLPTSKSPAKKQLPSPEICLYCQKEFSSRKSLYQHLRKHEPLSCPKCSKDFFFPSALYKHMQTHNPILHKCPHCGKEFKKPFNLKQHLRIHTGEKPFLCAACGKTFGDASTFRKHKLFAHTQERFLHCSTCGKSFYHQGHLHEHERKHTREKPYSCQVCSKTFMYSDSVKKHMVAHSGEHPFSCDQCGKNFRWRESLRQHVLMHRDNSQTQSQTLSMNDDNMTSGLALLFSPNDGQETLQQQPTDEYSQTITVQYF